MLIFLKNCKPLDYAEEEEKMASLINLLASHGQRKNIVVAPKRVLLDIMGSSIYSNNDKRYAADILETSREHFLLKEVMKIFVTVDFGEPEQATKKEDNEILISYSKFKDPISSGAIPFISENDKDYRFYKVIGNTYIRAKIGLNIDINLIHNLGAGSHCKAEFDRLSKVSPLLFCIVDNDKKHPKTKEGSTSSRFKFDDRDNYESGKLIKVLDMREVENLIPTKTIDDVCAKHYPPKIIDTFDEIKFLFKKEPNFIRYFDFKEGLSLKTAIELDKRYGSFWLPILKNLERFSKNRCFEEIECYGCLQCPKIDGFGENLLAHSLGVLEQDNLRNISKTLDSLLKNLWDDIGHHIVSWGCTTSSRLTRT
ncbi:hypothetical protein [Pseudoalteromonas sp. G24-MNA-CIBAN-0072]|uniref:hypothetical protein n=1 Tax=Pseudoalteromonas sp. G24-MNA-CIBAN-0072 TaxID=3140418 RepID=UPI00331BF429